MALVFEEHDQAPDVVARRIYTFIIHTAHNYRNVYGAGSLILLLFQKF